MTTVDEVVGERLVHVLVYSVVERVDCCIVFTT